MRASTRTNGRSAADADAPLVPSTLSIQQLLAVALAHGAATVHRLGWIEMSGSRKRRTSRPAEWYRARTPLPGRLDQPWCHRGTRSAVSQSR